MTPAELRRLMARPTTAEEERAEHLRTITATSMRLTARVLRLKTTRS